VTTDNKEQLVRYMMLIYQGSTPLPGTPEWDALGADEKGAVHAGYQDLNATPGMEPGRRMDGPDTATTVRVQDGSTLTTDGPFAETKEALGGYFFFEADDLQAAIEVAAKVPAAALGGAVEVREVLER
jgi:hypothetical protein